MNRNSFVLRSVRKSDARMPFEFNVENVLTGYISPQMHKNLRRLPSAKKKKSGYE